MLVWADIHSLPGLLTAFFGQTQSVCQGLSHPPEGSARIQGILASPWRRKRCSHLRSIAQSTHWSFGRDQEFRERWQNQGPYMKPGLSPDCNLSTSNLSHYFALTCLTQTLRSRIFHRTVSSSSVVAQLDWFWQQRLHIMVSRASCWSAITLQLAGLRWIWQ